MKCQLLLTCILAAVSMSTVNAESSLDPNIDTFATNIAISRCETPEGMHAECFEFMKNQALIWIAAGLPIVQPPAPPTPGPWADDPEHR